MAREKRDCSLVCNMNDDDDTNPCWECKYFLFPVGCMYGKNEDDIIIYTESEE